MHGTSPIISSTTGYASAPSAQPPLDPETRTSQLAFQISSLENPVSVTDLQKRIPNLKVIDKTTWKAYVDMGRLRLSIDDEPPVTPIDAENLASFASSVSVENDAGVTLLTLPQGLTVDKLSSIAQNPLQGHSHSFCYLVDHEEELKQLQIEKTCRVLLTNGLLQNTRNMSYETHVNQLQSKGWQMPEILPLLSLAIMTFITSTESPPKIFFPDDPWTYAHSLEKYGQNPIIVGGFTANELVLLECETGNETVGTGAALRLA